MKAILRATFALADDQMAKADDLRADLTEVLFELAKKASFHKDTTVSLVVEKVLEVKG